MVKQISEVPALTALGLDDLIPVSSGGVTKAVRYRDLVQAGTLTFQGTAGNDTASAASSLTRIGRQVFLSLNVDVGSGGAQHGTILATLPAGFIPAVQQPSGSGGYHNPAMIYAPDKSVTLGDVQVDSSGNVNFFLPGATLAPFTHIHCTITYPGV